MNDAAAARRGRRNGLRILYPRNQRLFAKDVEARIQRALDECRMAARRRADIDEIKRFAGQQVVDGLVPLSAGASLQKGPALRRNGIGRGDDLDILYGLPARQVPFRRDVSEPDKSATQHAPRPQSSPN